MKLKSAAKIFIGVNLRLLTKRFHANKSEFPQQLYLTNRQF